MKNITLAGNIGQNAETRRTQSGDAVAAASRIKASIAKKSVPADMAALYRDERSVIDEIMAADAAMHDELMASFKARKTALTQKHAA